MNLSEFDYSLSKDQIAQYPVSERDSSRLMVIHRKLRRIEHRIFRDLIEYLHPGDVIVLNNTKVIPARLYGRNSGTSGKKVEILLLKELRTNTWEAIVKGLNEGTVTLKQGITAHVSRLNGMASVKFNGGDIKGMINKIGVMPLPPYIKRPADGLDGEHYQTVYAEKEGAVAAPTAGLHFTKELLERIKEKGIDVKKLTLHVGYGTFKPVSCQEIERHQMEREYYEISEATANAINCAKSKGKRVIAVGTTVVRALEASAMSASESTITAGAAEASIFIYPGYKFKVIDALITNFHLPKSTPLMLTSAFSELQLLKKAYLEALNADYRFFSYGDAIFIQ